MNKNKNQLREQIINNSKEKEKEKDKEIGNKKSKEILSEG